MLEQLDYRLPCDAPANRELVERELRRAGLGEEPIEPLLQGLEQMRLCPFGGELGGLRVADLGPERRLNEMNFDLTLGFARAGGLAAAFLDHPGGAFGTAYAEALRALPVASQGFLTGSIDLVFPACGARGGGALVGGRLEKQLDGPAGWGGAAPGLRSAPLRPRGDGRS